MDEEFTDVARGRFLRQAIEKFMRDLCLARCEHGREAGARAAAKPCQDGPGPWRCGKSLGKRNEHRDDLTVLIGEELVDAVAGNRDHPPRVRGADRTDGLRTDRPGTIPAGAGSRPSVR
ncbi:hypothetical protein ACWGI8_06565 [Streptomyces sp. NPDC054841]